MRFLPILAVAAAAAAFYYYRDRSAGERQREVADPYAGGPVPDDVLTNRVRTRIGHVLLNARSVEARASHGVVVLRGTLTLAERDRALAAVLAVPGVTRVANYLESQDMREEMIGTQGAIPRAN